MRPRATAVVLLLLTVPLVGCLGQDEDLQMQRADVTRTLGGVEGVVTDDAIQPVLGANVTLVETEQTVQTAEDGSYAISQVEPGTYTLVVRADGFVSQRSEVTVRAGEVSVVDLLMPHLVSQEAYMQQVEMVGFVECGLAWKVEGPVQVGGVTYQAVAACAAVNLITGANATNDRFMHVSDLEAPIETMVYELAWDDGGQAGGSSLSSVVEIRGFTNTNGSRFISVSGTSPLYSAVNKTQFEDLDQNFTQRCEDGDDDWCGHNFWDKGWPLQLRVFAYWDCQDTPARACFTLQQEFTHYISAFYNEPAPEGFRITEPSA